MKQIRCEECEYGQDGRSCSEAQGYNGSCKHPSGGPDDFFTPMETNMLKTDERDEYKDCHTYTGTNIMECTGVSGYCLWCPKYKRNLTKESEPEWNDAVLRYGEGEESIDGLKYDVHKTDLTFLSDWDLALEEICKLSAFGAEKYERSGWTKITDPNRLKACMLRHYLKEKAGEPDEDSGFMHDVAVAWNALSALQIRLQNDRENDQL
jgi:hypothetical protein